MQQGWPPKNCREAFTAEGDQVYPNRYYTSDFSMAKFLGGDLETEIRQISFHINASAVNKRADCCKEIMCHRVKTSRKPET